MSDPTCPNCGGDTFRWGMNYRFFGCCGCDWNARVWPEESAAVPPTPERNDPEFAAKKGEFDG